MAPSAAPRPVTARRGGTPVPQASAPASSPLGSRTPSLEALGRIASTVVRETRHFGSMPLGLTGDDLVAEGWVAWIEHAQRYPRAADRTLYTRARFAMLDAVREAMAPATGAPSHNASTAEPLTEALAVAAPLHPAPDAPVRRFRLRRADIASFRAYCGRRLSARGTRLMWGLCIEGRTLDEMAAALGLTRPQAWVARSHAITALLAGRG